MAEFTVKASGFDFTVSPAFHGSMKASWLNDLEWMLDKISLCLFNIAMV